MKKQAPDAEIQWQVLKAMLDEFPTLREKTKKYLDNPESHRRVSS